MLGSEIGSHTICSCTPYSVPNPGLQDIVPEQFRAFTPATCFTKPSFLPRISKADPEPSAGYAYFGANLSCWVANWDHEPSFGSRKLHCSADLSCHLGEFSDFDSERKGYFCPLDTTHFSALYLRIATHDSEICVWYVHFGIDTSCVVANLAHIPSFSIHSRVTSLYLKES